METWGKFEGLPITKWCIEKDAPDRWMLMDSDFKYIDPRNREWPAPINSWINGASIPRALWTTIGSPFTGDYRLASIVHDVACIQKNLNYFDRLEADKMMFEACRCGGCSPRESLLIYIGVRIGALLKYDPDVPPPASSKNYVPRIEETAKDKLIQKWLKKTYNSIHTKNSELQELSIEDYQQKIDEILASSMSLNLNEFKSR